MATSKKIIEQKAQQALDSLNKSVKDMLEKKRRLGKYAVIWDGEKVVRIFPNNKPKTPAYLKPKLIKWFINFTTSPPVR